MTNPANNSGRFSLTDVIMVVATIAFVVALAALLVPKTAFGETEQTIDDVKFTVCYQSTSGYYCATGNLEQVNAIIENVGG